jgi:hypothetical protein
VTISLLFKIAILLLLGLILVSLGSGLLFLVRDGGKTKRVITSLSVRIALSIILFLMLIIGYFTGIIQPRGSPPARIDGPGE